MATNAADAVAILKGEDIPSLSENEGTGTSSSGNTGSEAAAEIEANLAK
jgi:hypothetical protein